MNFVVAATVFPIIFIGELPDKSMFAALVLATRGRAIAVWTGASAAFAIHMVIAVTAGTTLVHFLPRQVLEAAVAVLFLVGALLAIREIRQHKNHQDSAGPAPGTTPQTPIRAAVTAFLVVFVAEWGDLTQVLAASLAAQYDSPVSVGVGSVLALWAVAAVAVTGGRWLTRVVDAVKLRAGTALILAGFAGYAAWLAVN